jgi:hypothetical protein
MQTITVAATSNAQGRAQRIAKGKGKQRTVSVDFSKSDAWNAGNAAGTLANVLGWKPEHRIERGEKWGTFVNHDL